MEHMPILKISILSSMGIIGGYIAQLFGGWDTALNTLIIFMAADYITGLMVAGVFRKSGKTESGAIESHVSWKGLCKKGVTLLVVLVACRLDILIGTDFVKDAVVIGYIVSELISITENAGLMGVPIPEKLKKAIEVLKDKAES